MSEEEPNVAAPVPENTAGDPIPAAAPVPVTEPAASPEPAVEGAATPSISPEATPTEAEKSPAHTDTPTLMETAGNEKPSDADHDGEPTVAPQDVVTYEFKFPEGTNGDPEQINAYKSILSEHKISPEVGQLILDRHIAAVQQLATHLQTEQHRIFQETRRQWQEQIKSDEQIGGAGFGTTTKAVARVRDLFVPAERMGAFNDMLRVTGVGDHPEFWRFMRNVATRFDEPAPPIHTGSPPPNAGTRTGKSDLKSIYR